MERIDEVAITNHVPLPNQGDCGGWVRGSIQSHSGWQGTVAERSRIFDSGARTRCGSSRIMASKKESPVVTEAEELLPFTVPEVRRLIWYLVWRKIPTPEQVVNWSRWRRTHQARAKRSHYKRNEAQHKQLQL